MAEWRHGRGGAVVGAALGPWGARGRAPPRRRARAGGGSVSGRSRGRVGRFLVSVHVARTMDGNGRGIGKRSRRSAGCRVHGRPRSGADVVRPARPARAWAPRGDAAPIRLAPECQTRVGARLRPRPRRPLVAKRGRRAVHGQKHAGHRRQVETLPIRSGGCRVRGRGRGCRVHGRGWGCRVHGRGRRATRGPVATLKLASAASSDGPSRVARALVLVLAV